MRLSELQRGTLQELRTDPEFMLEAPHLSGSSLARSLSKGLRLNESGGVRKMPVMMFVNEKATLRRSVTNGRLQRRGLHGPCTLGD